MVVCVLVPMINQSFYRRNLPWWAARWPQFCPDGRPVTAPGAGRQLPETPAVLCQIRGRSEIVVTHSPPSTYARSLHPSLYKTRILSFSYSHHHLSRTHYDSQHETISRLCFRHRTTTSNARVSVLSSSIPLRMPTAEAFSLRSHT